MRLRIILGMSAVAMLAVLIGSDGYGQFKGGPGGFGGGPGGPGGQRKMGMGTMDPNQRFDQYAQGKEYFLLADVQGFMNTMLTAYAKEKNVNFQNGQVTRQDYLAFSTWMQEKRASGFNFRTLFQNGASTTTPGSSNTTSASPGSTGANTDALKQMADLDFKTHDENGDGKLNTDEMPGPLRRDLARWDKNKDGQIDLNEYRDYFIERQQQRMARQNGGSPGMQQFMPNVVEATLDDELDKRPVVYRAGKLPTKGMPPWFVQLDTDADGQVALYEWRTAGRDLEEFKEWDRDNDGFITPEEAIHAYAALTKTPDPLLAANVDAEKASPGMQQFNMFNRGPGRFGGGPGGFGGGFGGPGRFGGGPGGFGGGPGGFGGGPGRFGGGPGGFGGGKGRFGGQGGFNPGGFNPGGFNPANGGQSPWSGGKGKGKGRGGFNGG